MTRCGTPAAILFSGNADGCLTNAARPELERTGSITDHRGKVAAAAYGGELLQSRMRLHKSVREFAMFTGLVEGLGVVAAVVREPAGMRVDIQPPVEMCAGCRVGDSVAISGCCLTVIAITDGRWSFQAGTETLSKTNLGRLQPGDRVNLERSLPVDGRLGGHFVQGHVDAVGHVERIVREADWITMTFRVPAELAELMVPKGSVAVDGVSLTLVAVEAERFSVALIPHTLSVTTLGLRQEGEAVNIETDILGKYVRKFVAADR
jgi:riboflavin synthase